MEKLIGHIKTQINIELPGAKSHNKVIPEVRRNIPNSKAPIAKASVLILLFPFNNKPSFVLIKRPVYKGAHSGQVSLPGGKFEKEDSNLEHTALRETQEELGVEKSSVSVIGKLSPISIPVSNMQVFPYIGYTLNEPYWKPDKKEVEYYIIESVEHLLLDSTKKITKMDFAEQVYDVPYFDIRNEIVWGATAMILSEFVDVINR